MKAEPPIVPKNILGSIEFGCGSDFFARTIGSAKK
jgi:hypothetical protein